MPSSRSIALALLVLNGSPAVQAVSAPVPRTASRQESPAKEGIRAYLARLAERGMTAEIVREGEAFLRGAPSSPDADVVRYRVGCAYAASGRDADAARLLEPLAARTDFEFAAEAGVRCAEIALRANTGGNADGKDAARAERFLERAETSARGATRDAVRALLARARLAAGRPDAAVEAARALRRDGETAAVRREAILIEAWAHLRRSDPQACALCTRALLADAEATADERAEASVVLGEALLDAHRPAEALDSFAAVPAGPWRSAALRGSGFALAALGRHAESAREFTAALRADPNGPQAAECALQAGVEHLAAGDARAASAAFSERALDAHPHAIEWRARAASAGGDADTALAVLAAAPPSRERDDTARRRARLRGEILESAGRPAEAARAYADCGDSAGLVDAARASLVAEDAQQALQYAESALRTRGEGASELAARIALGEAAFRLERWTDARASFDAAARLEPDAARSARITSRAAWSAWNGGDARGTVDAVRAALPALQGSEREEAQFLLARALETLRDPAAVTAWRAFLAEHPDSTRAREVVLRLARSLQPDEARVLIGNALARASDPTRAVELYAELGEIESRAKNYVAARAAYERALELDAGTLDEVVRYGAAFACAALGDDEAAERALAPIFGIDAPLDAGVAAFELGALLRVRAADGPGAFDRWSRLERAGATVERSLASLRPILPLLLAKLGAERHAQTIDPALAGLAARARGAELALVEIERGWLAISLHDAPGAARAIERAASVSARDASSSVHLGELRLACGEEFARVAKTAEAEAQFRAAAADPAALARALLALAWSQLERGDDVGALADLERFERECTSSPERPRALTLQGEALWRLGRHETCVHVLTAARAIVRDPALRAIVLERLGSALARMERWREADEALAEFTRAFPDAPGRPTAELDRGRALARIGDVRGARVCLDRAVLAGGATASRARVERARLSRAAGDLDAALSDALKAALLVDDPESSPEALLLAAEILDEQGETAAARARRAELVERYPRSPAGLRASQSASARDASTPKSRGGDR